MKKRVIAIAFSDLHINLWSKHNKDNLRTLNTLRVLSIIKKACKKYSVPALFCGDMFHDYNIDAELLDMVTWYMSELNDNWRCLGISGNHEHKQKNSFKNPSKNLLTSMERWTNWFQCINYETVIGKDTAVHGIPYTDNNKDINEVISNINPVEGKVNILLLHTDYPGAEDTDGRRIDSAENLNPNMFKKFQLVLCGHIHKHQRLSKKVYMVGAPMQQRRTDRNSDMGYLKIYSDLSIKFVPLDLPKFIDVESEDEIKDDGNYYTVVKKRLKEVKADKEYNPIAKGMSRKRIARHYLSSTGITESGKKKKTKISISKSHD